MKYTCDQCKYQTPDKSNYNRHMKSVAHNELLASNAKKFADNANDKRLVNNIYSCTCGKVFAHQSSLSRHKISCNNINLSNQVELLVDKIEEIKKEFKKENESLKNQLLDYVKNNKQTVNNNYVSVKNYVQQNFPNAPALEGIKEYDKLTFEDNDLIDTLISNYNYDTLHTYLGKFIVGYYKKDDPAEQSLWTSDVSRLTYIIKELLENNKSIWSHDFKGIKVKLCIVLPLLKYIRKCIDEYWVNNLDNMKYIETNKLVELQEKFITLQKIKKDISNDIIANDIVRSIAPYFSMDKKNITDDIADD